MTQFKWLSNLNESVSAVGGRMSKNFLKLNEDTTEILFVGAQIWAIHFFQNYKIEPRRHDHKKAILVSSYLD